MSVTLPKDALQRVQMGQSFAEYDFVRNDASIFVVTPASLVADNLENKKCFFVGRRGAGKTAITYNMLAKHKRAISLIPQIFDLIKLPLNHAEFQDTRQRPFKSLVCAFERALLGELLRCWIQTNTWEFGDNHPAISKERGLIENLDFDAQTLKLVSEIFDAYNSPQERLWLRQINRAKELIGEINNLRENANFDFIFLIDRLDESWDGSDSAIICLMALMHCCVHITAMCPSLRPYLFIRENIYSRIREMDNEFSRLETSVVFLDWTTEKLTEFVERRLIRSFTTKPPLGEVWPHFFEEENGYDSKQEIFSYCQNRPRDVVTYVSFALESAISHGRRKIAGADIKSARERFSTSKLKDLADEFSENYSNIHLVLQLFYGLSTGYTLLAIENFIQKLLVDPKVTSFCKSWFYNVTSPHQFVEVFFSIGFFGIKEDKRTLFKSAGGDASFMPPLSGATTIFIHPAYHSALHLRDMVLPSITDEVILQVNGILEELPDGISFDNYQKRLKELLQGLDKIQHGRNDAGEFETFVGETIKLCFYRSLTNVQPKVRTIGGLTIKDWVASNRARTGFWETIRNKYAATQVVWECKNYDELSADDFHQAKYYMTDIGTRFIVIVYRGTELKTSYFNHIQKIAQNTKGFVLLITEKDLKVFLRQAMNGKFKEDHINELYDRTERSFN